MPHRTFAVAAILFDSDGVLVDSDASVRHAWTRWAVEHGFDPDDVFRAVHGRRAADTVAALVEPAHRDGSLARIDRYELEGAAEVRAIAGAVALTTGLPTRAWAVVTSATAARAAARLGAAGIPTPPVLVTADHVAQGKPAPDGYLAAARALGVDPAACAVVEDAGSGVAAARAAGVGLVVGIGARALDTDADIVVSDLTHLGFDAATSTLRVAGPHLRAR